MHMEPWTNFGISPGISRYCAVMLDQQVFPSLPGNYVVQHTLEHGSPLQKQQLCQAVPQKTAVCQVGLFDFPWFSHCFPIVCP